MGASTSAGARLYIGTTAAVGATDTFIEVSEIVTIPSFGRKYNVVKYNPLNTRGTQKFKGSFDDGDVAIGLGKDLSNTGQLALQTALGIDLDYNIKITANDAVAPVTSTVTITVAAPGVVTWTAHGLPAGAAVKFATSGTLPTGLVAGTTYYVTNDSNLTANTFAVSSSLANSVAGTAITTSGSAGTGHSGTSIPVGSTQLFKAKVTGYETNYASVDSVLMATATLDITSGSLVDTPHVP
jgi:hypothetical protein